MQVKTIRHLILATSLAVAAPLAVMAQPGDGAARDGARTPQASMHKAHFNKNHHAHFRHAGAYGAHGKNMMRDLDLTQEQRDKLFELRHAQAPKMRELMRTMRDSQRELRQLSMSDSFDEAKARTLADAAAQAGASMALQRAQLQNETFKILTPEQREKLAKRIESRGERRRGGPAAQGPGRS